MATVKTLSLLDSTIGKKAVMALTGLVLYGFVIVHMAGNLQIFLGPVAFNGYAATLKATPLLLWGARSVLLVSAALHVWAAVSLLGSTSAARSVDYKLRRYNRTSQAALSMKYGGFALLAFILFHIAHFTAPGTGLGIYKHSHTDVYANVVSSFSVWWVVAIYLVAQVFLGLHLFHGSWSLIQTLGFSHPRYDRMKQILPQGIGIGVAAGNILIALSVFAGIVRCRSSLRLHAWPSHPFLRPSPRRRHRFAARVTRAVSCRGARAGPSSRAGLATGSR